SPRRRGAAPTRIGEIMVDQGTSPQPSEPSGASYPPAADAVAPAQSQVPPVGNAVPPVYGSTAPVRLEDRRRGRRGWWIAIAIVLLLLLACGCVVPTVLLMRAGGGSKARLSGFGSDAVAVIHVDGAIAGTGDTYSGYITPEYFLDQLQQAEDDSRVKAILLRVDSPGGTVAASEEIAEYVRTCPKPVVVSIGDVGASGAYMMSSQADEIWAMPGSTVGSIGVISEIPNVSGLLDKVGVQFQVITAGKYKDAGSPYRKLSDEERALIKGEVDEAYEQFIAIVAKGREMSKADVTELATGWAWSGDKALKLGLVDKIGTYQQALDAAADRGGIKGDYDTVTYEDEFSSLLSPLMGLVDRLGGIGDATSRTSAVRNGVPR
ncbi:MAG TPA: signal peptide peptidase SppA, partial [Coriobacteriia bacterium]|nr:signal peptide peptidase SppA [Coriobacteriia bacterium]